MPRYCFSDFVLSPRRRLLVRDGRELPLIPRYFDLLVYLVEHRQEAVHRRDIFEHVWHDVVVSDSALSQAIRTIRQTLDDDSREPRFIRTVSRHGYQFVYESVAEEDEEPAPPLTGARSIPAGTLAAAMGGGLAGIAAGIGGGLLLAVAPGSTAPLSVVPVLALIGGACGAAGGAGVGAGLAAADARAKSRRALAMIVGGAVGGGLIGWIAEWLARWTLAGVVGTRVDVGGGLEGLIIGAAAGLALAFAAPDEEPSTRARVRSAIVTAAVCGLGAGIIALTGRPLVGGTLHNIALASGGAEIVLTPLGRLIGDPEFGPVSRVVMGIGEAAVFGLGLALGFTYRRKSLESHAPLTKR